MAEINTVNGRCKQGRGVKKNKKLSTRVDLTPMVDLGFLLITFFIFTTTMSEATAMKLFLPKDASPTPIKASGALTLLLSKNDLVYYYEGQLNPDASNFHATTYGGIRDLIIRKKSSVDPKDFMVIIKAQKESVYKNAVDALDEMTINDVKRYALIDILPVEEQFIGIAESGSAK